MLKNAVLRFKRDKNQQSFPLATVTLKEDIEEV